MDIVKRLNEEVKCTIAPSEIHGVGVFAIRDIKEGERLNCWPEKGFQIHLDSLDGLLPEVRALILQRWPIAIEGKPFLHPNDDARLLSFMNHSNMPNYNPYLDLSTRDIKKGEEITEDYGRFKPR